MSINELGTTCPQCDRSHDELARKCSGCGFELTPMADFYPALWAYGCPDYEECREQLEFEDGELRCPRHGCAYLPGEQQLDEPIVFDTLTMYDMGTHVLRPIEASVDREFDRYTIMPCPKCDPSGYFCDPDGPKGSSRPTLYTQDDEEGQQLHASCRKCGLSNSEYLKLILQQGEGAPESGYALSSKIDKFSDKVSEAESLIESSVTTYRETTTPRWLQLTVGLLSLPLSGLLALGSFGFSTSIMDGSVSDWQSLVALAVIVALSVFFGMVAYRLLLGRSRSSDGHLLSPTFMIAFGIFLIAVYVWMLIEGDGNSYMVLFGLGALSTGLAWRTRSRHATLDGRSRKSGRDKAAP